MVLKKRTVMLLSVVVLSFGIMLTSQASAYTISNGVMNTLDEVSDVDLTGSIIYAINCGQGLRQGNPPANPYLTGNGSNWGSSSDSQDLIVAGVMFYCDMWSTKDEARNYNSEYHDGLTDRDLYGLVDDSWRYLPERGNANPGSDDGGIAGFANYVSGYNSRNQNWQSPYEGTHSFNTSGMFSGDSSQDAANLRTILARSGAQNLGSYNSSQGCGERDMTFAFDVTEGVRYKLQILFYKNSGEATGMRIAVEAPDNIVVNQLNVDAECTASAGLVYSYEFTAASDNFTVYMGRQSDNGNNNIGDVAAITIKDLTFASAVSPADGMTKVDLTANLIWTPGQSVQAHEVYLGTNETAVQNALPLRADLHYDAIVNLADMAVLGNSWLQEMTACADIDDSGLVDTGDLVMLADNWLNIGDGIFRAYLPAGTTTFDPGMLDADQSYFWRIDELTSTGRHSGYTWQFRTETAFATDYYPSNGNALYTGQELTWTAGVFATSHDVYFGTDEDTVAYADSDSDEFIRNQTRTSYDPCNLDSDTVYYWRIDQVDASNTYKGTVQSFSIGIDKNTLTGKVMAGYQMWFKTPSDPNTGGTDGFTHYNRNDNFSPGSCSIDYWPDMSEMDPDEKYLTTFVHADSSPAYVYHSEHPKTVDRHFKWMKDYGISGVFVQKFGADVSREGLLLCRDIAPKYGRVFALMYDLTNQTVARLEDIKAEFKMFIDTEGLLDSPAYLHHNGKPVIAIWGLGFNHNFTEEREYNPGVEGLLDFFKNDPNYGDNTVMVGVDNNWMTATIADTTIKTLVEDYCDIVSPWEVGRYSHDAGIEEKRDDYWISEINWCNANGKFYLPVNWPGFSWYNMDPSSNVLDQVPRNGGQFMWKQFYEAIDSGAQALYIAMFDEMDEGTAIFKCAADPPVGASPFLNYYNDQGDMPSDEYLWLTGQAQRMLRSEIPLVEIRPAR